MLGFESKEVREAVAYIQAGWSEKTRRKRAGERVRTGDVTRRVSFKRILDMRDPITRDCINNLDREE